MSLHPFPPSLPPHFCPFVCIPFILESVLELTPGCLFPAALNCRFGTRRLQFPQGARQSSVTVLFLNMHLNVADQKSRRRLWVLSTGRNLLHPPVLLTEHESCLVQGSLTPENTGKIQRLHGRRAERRGWLCEPHTCFLLQLLYQTVRFMQLFLILKDLKLYISLSYISALQDVVCLGQVKLVTDHHAGTQRGQASISHFRVLITISAPTK